MKFSKAEQTKHRTQAQRRAQEQRKYAKAREAVKEQKFCHDCRRWLGEEGGEAHHVKFRSHGGTNEVDNLVKLCHECHVKRHGR